MAFKRTRTPKRGVKSAMSSREDWLNRFITEARPVFEAAGFPIPVEVRASVGFTSKGARGKRIGECWSQAASGDGHFEIFLVPQLGDERDHPAHIAAVLTHELVHAAVGLEAGHGTKFKKAAKAVGLGGKMKATVPTPAWATWANPALDRLGKLPHAPMSGASSGEKKQTTRLLKCECASCGFTFRATKTWVEGKALTCPDGECGGEVEVAA